MKFISYIIFFCSLFIFIASPLIASDHEYVNIGDTFKGSVKNLYEQEINISLPPGLWELMKNETNNNTQVLEFSDGRGWLTVYVPRVKVSSGFRWRGGSLKKCTDSNENGIRDKIYHAGVSRSHVTTTYCIAHRKFLDTQDEYLVITLHARTGRNQSSLMWLQYYLYYPISESKVESLSKKDLKYFGNMLMSEIKDNFNKKSSDMYFIDGLLR